MKKYAKSFSKSILGIICAGLFLVQPLDASPRGPQGFADIIDPLLPAVVNIATIAEIPSQEVDLPNIPENSPFHEFFKHFFEKHYSKPQKAMALGSGFIISPEGYIVTNNHVIADAEKITVILHDKTEYKGKVIGRDLRTDLALIKIEPKKPLLALKWGDSQKAHAGDWVLAVGNPFGLGGTVTAGIISTIARHISGQIRGAAASTDIIDGYIQTDASINVGNSGGPMINMEGDVIGINSAILSPSGTNIGIGFAIPSEVAKPVIEQLKKYGHTRRGWLGVRVQQVTDEIATALGIGKARGALVGSVTKGGPAAKAGIKPRDVILKFNGKEIEDSRSLPRIVGDTEIGSTVPIEVWRDGKTIDLKVKIGEFEEAQKEGLISSPKPSQKVIQKSKEILGMKLRELGPQDNLPENVKGVLIADVEDNSEAFEKGIREGDVIFDVGKVAVTTPDQVITQIKKDQKEKKKYEIFGIRRGNNELYIALSVEPETKGSK